ncbi:hypothetical protein FHS07_000593 [Microbacterium proteolyticum]|uniref:Uncharacterized protein n=1 Tax=Microbacterium proteolyticum TaxID=1572644 RepID=A0A7W5GDW1_9MICO|nr:hypothetical protein [Microbacterium proteolyticum]
MIADAAWKPEPEPASLSGFRGVFSRAATSPGVFTHPG